MIESILVGVFVFLTLLFASLYLSQIKKNRAILANTLQLLIMQQSISDENKTDKEQANEDFLKFVSDSRDWAYQYIEDVQDKINKFITDVEPEIAYFDEYGLVGDAYPHYYSMKKISGAYKELKKTLPNEEGNH
jgi:alpha-L-fucosidase